jgi:hypothetical protein
MNGYKTFGDALIGVKKGHKARRKAWHKAMYIYLDMGQYDFVEDLGVINGIRTVLFNKVGEGEQTILPSICVMNRYGNVCMGWAPSQPDMLAEDWEVIFV